MKFFIKTIAWIILLSLLLLSATSCGIDGKKDKAIETGLDILDAESEYNSNLRLLQE